MSHTVSAKDEFRAYMVISPFWTLTYVLAAATGIGRAFYVYLFMEHDTVAEFVFKATGLFTPWFNAWIVMLIFGLLLGVNRDKVDVMAKQISASRQVADKE